MLRIVPFEGLINETTQNGIMPKVMVPRFELDFTQPKALPEPPNLG